MVYGHPQGSAICFLCLCEANYAILFPLLFSELPPSNGFLIIEANGGLNQQRLSVCTSVQTFGTCSHFKTNIS